MIWIRQKFGDWIHVLFIVVAALCFSGIASAQRERGGDIYLYEKLQDQERHIDNTDVNVKENAKDIKEAGNQIMALREQIEQYKNYALGFSGCFVLFVGFLKYLGRKGDQSA